MFAVLLFASMGSAVDDANASKPKKIVLIAGVKSHGPVGNGIHDYGWSVCLLRSLLETSAVADRIQVEHHLDGWPKDARTLDDADSIMVISDGRDGELYSEAPHLESDARVAEVERHIKRGCGFVTFHFSTFAPDKHADKVLRWTGGYFDWETENKRLWYSAIRTIEAPVEPTVEGNAASTILRGVSPFRLREEFYYNLRLSPDAKPVLKVPALDGRKPDGNIVAWTIERPDGGRGFGTTCGHFYDNWRNEDFRKLLLNAILWTAKVETPTSGLDSKFLTHDEIKSHLGSESTPKDPPIRVVMFAGNEAHAWHNWKKTTPAIVAALKCDPRIQVEVSNDIEDMAKGRLANADVVVQNYVNWHDPAGLSKESQKAFLDFLKRGGGLVVLHFANGAFHYSLPNAEKSDWPEYRAIVPRVWNHRAENGKPASGHDAYGPFHVVVQDSKHPLTQGLTRFDTVDELYFGQIGSATIAPLLVAHSKITKQMEPLAWTSTYGKARVFQSLLGHSEKTYGVFQVREMLRRAVAWTANRRLSPIDQSTEKKTDELSCFDFDKST